MKDEEGYSAPLITTEHKQKVLFDDEMDTEHDEQQVEEPIRLSVAPQLFQGRICIDEATCWQRFTFNWAKPFLRVSVSKGNHKLTLLASPQDFVAPGHVR